MTYYHVFWPRPQLRPGVKPESQDLFLWDFELLTWILSCLQARQFAPVRLITDTRGAVAAERAGLIPLYNGGISTGLDAVPLDLDNDVFWSGGKLYAFGQMQTPCICVDLDAVLWQPLRPSSPVMALHVENKDWFWYKDNRREYGPFGFDGPEWDWELNPFNAGVLYLGHAEAARHYARTACAFAERYSREVCSDPAKRPAGSHATLFAEQRLLPMCAAHFNIAVQPITRTQLLTTCLPQNPECLHLWRSKLAYKLCADARLAFVNWTIGYLLKEFPEARPVLARWDLDHTQERLEPRPIDPSEFAQVHQSDLRFSLIKEATGTISVKDLTTGISRKASQGGMVWSGEIIHPEAGAEFELEVIGAQSLKFRALA